MALTQVTQKDESRTHRTRVVQNINTFYLDPRGHMCVRTTMCTKMIFTRHIRGRPRLRWIDVVKKDLQCINLSLLDAVQSASDRAAWLEIVNRCVDLMQ